MLFEFNNEFINNDALYTLDGEVITYVQLEDKIIEFTSTSQLKNKNGLFLVEASNTVDSIIAYLAGLRTKNPVILVNSSESQLWLNYQETFPVTHCYSKNEGYQYNKRHCVFTKELAVLLSTSGTTDSTKSVMLNRLNIESNAIAIIEYLNITKADKSPTTLSFSYSYGLSVLNSHLLAGASILLTDKSVIDDSFWSDFKKYNCTGLAGVPHIHELIMGAEIDTSCFPSLRYMTQAGGRLDKSLVKQILSNSCEENWKFYVMYGQTEATARIAYLPPENAANNFDCIGKSIPGGSIELLDSQANPITQTGVSGEIVYSGPNVMLGYAMTIDDLVAPERPAKLFTGDIAEINENGYFRILGRMKRFIKPFGLRVNLDEIEARLSECNYDVACTGTDEQLLVFSSHYYNSGDLYSKIESILGLPKNYISYKHIKNIPRLSSGKIDYRSLSKLYEKEPKAELQYNQSSSDSVISIFTKFFPHSDVSLRDSFETLGGDSLNFIGVSTKLKKHLGNLPSNWQQKPISELVNTVAHRTNRYFTFVDSNILLRAIAIVLIVLGHLSVFDYGGTASLTLFVLAGFTFAKFTLPVIRNSESIKPLLVLITKVVLLVFAYLFAIQLVTGKWDFPSLLLISNYYDPGRPNVYINWFIEVYIQLLLLLTLLFSSKWVRELEKNNSYRFFYAFTIVFMIMLVAIPKIWDTDYLFNRVPHMLAWLFSMGVVIELSKSRQQKFLTLALFIIGYFLDVGMEIKLLLFAGLILIFVERFITPRFIDKVFVEIAGSSLFIYISHLQFNGIVGRLGFNNIVGSIVALVAGIIGWQLYVKSLELMSHLYRKI